jgi:hypothetical protein
VSAHHGLRRPRGRVRVSSATGTGHRHNQSSVWAHHGHDLNLAHHDPSTADSVNPSAP